MQKERKARTRNGWGMTSVLFAFQSDGRYKGILLSLERTANDSQEIQEWWIVDQPSSGLVRLGGSAPTDARREAGLQIFVFSDKVSPPSLGFLAGYGYCARSDRSPSAAAPSAPFLFSACVPQHYGTVRLRGVGHREIRAGIFQRNQSLHHV